MSYGKGHNVFSDIPGFDASKGERIVKALQRLWAKIEHLEQIRISEKKSRSKEVQTSSSDEDLTITDVQYKLLVLQLQYARCILRKNVNKDNFVIQGENAANGQISVEENKDKGSSFEYHNFEAFKNDAVCQGTQTGSSLIEDINLERNMDNQRNQDVVDAQVNTDCQVFDYENSREHTQSASTSHKIMSSCSRLSSRPHYHFKLDDVPFLLGASSTASHSIVANVQNIIAMMKTHNKALCGPKHVRVPSTNIQSCRGDSQDSSKMLNELSQDLFELRQRQANIIKRVDATQGKNSHFCKLLDVQDKTKANKDNEGSLKVYEEPRRARSTSESTKLQAEVNVSKLRGKGISKYNVQQRQILSSTRNQFNNLPIIARRNLLRSLQNFKTHLSEEDISWE